MKFYYKFFICLAIICNLNSNAKAFQKYPQVIDLRDKSYEQAIKSINSSSGKDLVIWQFKAQNNSEVSLCVLKTNTPIFELKAFVLDKTTTLSSVISNNQAVFGINGGYFNLNNGKSTSYIGCGNKIMADPRDNSDLTENPNLKPFLNQIFNRSELRMIVYKNKTIFKICPHDTRIEPNEELIWSIQAGPQLLPTITANQEAFIRTNPSDGKRVDSIGCELNKARSAVGITSDNKIMLVCVAGPSQNSSSLGIKICDLASLFKDLNCSNALNFDGGSSTSMVGYILDDNQEAQQKNFCIKNPPTKIKSGLLITTRAHY